MTQYISKSAIVAEIEKLKGKISDGSSYCNGWQHALRMLELSLDTLEVKGVDLEEEIKNYFKGFGKFASVGIDDCIDIAKYFFALGLFSQLTWQDIRLISEIGEDFMNSEESDDLWKDEEVYYTAILNKLKEKGRDYKTERQITRELEQKGEEL